MKYKERQKVYLDSIVNKADPVLGPRNVHIDINNLCQLNCVTCWNYSPDLTDKKTKSWKNKYISKELVFGLLKDLSKLSTERIILSGGGEIFFHPEIMDIIREVKRLGFKLTLISNVLAMTENQAYELVELKVDTILANVSSGNAGTYVDYHPNQDIDSYGKLLRLFDILRDLRDLKFVQVINGVNYHNIMDMLRLAAEYDVKTQFKLASLSAAGTEKYMLSEKQTLELIDKKKLYISYAKTLNIDSGLESFYKQLEGSVDHKYPIKEVGCYAGYLYSRVDIDGNVKFCCKNFVVGNLNNNSFNDIWFNSTPLKKYREDMNNGKYYPECSYCGNWTMNFKMNEELKSERD